MKLSKLALTPEGTIQAIVVTTNAENLPEVVVRSLTTDELRKVVDTYNAVAEAAEGSNGLPYMMTFQLLKDEDVPEPVETFV